MVSTVVLLLFIGVSFGGAAQQNQEALVIEKGIAELQMLMETGTLSAESLTRAYLARIERLDGPLNAVLAVSPDAVAQARELDVERKNGNVRGPLHGIPVLLKDNIESRENLPTTAGSLALADNVTRRDAFFVAQLREAGMVILGKTNLSEWANFRSERSSSGWSGVGGQTMNPYDVTRSPCGSSAGSGVAAAAGFAAVAIGTETNGSVVCPSTVNGIVGIKPTVGLISRSGIVPISHSQDTAGPMARTVADAVVVFAAMIGIDENDTATEIAAAAASWDLLEQLKKDGLKGKRIGVVRSSAGFHSEVDKLLEQAISDLKTGGATVVDGLEFDPPEGLSQAAYDVLLYEFKYGLNNYLAGLPNNDQLPAKTLEQLINFNLKHQAKEMPFFDQEIFDLSQAKGPLSDQGYQQALELMQQACRKDGIDKMVDEHTLDALIAPTGSPAWKIDLINGDHYIGGSSSYPARAGYPNITVPMGAVHGMPVGLSFFGPALSEPTLIEIAYAYEQASKRRVPPEL